MYNLEKLARIDRAMQWRVTGREWATIRQSEFLWIDDLTVVVIEKFLF
jgi:hypothetical protein